MISKAVSINARFPRFEQKVEDRARKFLQYDNDVEEQLYPLTLNVPFDCDRQLHLEGEQDSRAPLESFHGAWVD